MSALAVVSVVCSAVQMMFLQLQFPSEHFAAFQPPSHTIERAAQRDRERGGRERGERGKRKRGESLVTNSTIATYVRMYSSKRPVNEACFSISEMLNLNSS